jgi:multiple sugar transport system permease protein
MEDGVVSLHREYHECFTYRILERIEFFSDRYMEIELIKRLPAKVLRSKSEIQLRNTVVIMLVLFYVLFFYLPIIIAFVGSFHAWNPLKQQFSFLGLKNWIKVFTSQLFWKSFVNTLVFASVSVLFRIILGLLLSSILFSTLVKHKSFFNLVYYLPTITPMVAVAYVWKFIYDPQMGLLNQLTNSTVNWLFDGRYALLAILGLTIWKDFGFAIVILLGGMYSLPTDCFEAARIDGSTAWQSFWLITMPLLRNTIFFIIITSLISYFQTYIPVMVLTEGGPGTATYLASYLIYNEAFMKYNFGYASALSFVLFVVIAILTLISFRLGSDRSPKGGKGSTHAA